MAPKPTNSYGALNIGTDADKTQPYKVPTQCPHVAEQARRFQRPQVQEYRDNYSNELTRHLFPHLRHRALGVKPRV